MNEQQQLLIAKATGVLGFSHALVLVLAPFKEKAYVSKEYEHVKNPEILGSIRYGVRWTHMCTINLQLTWWLHVEQGLPREQAIGLGTIPWIVLCLYAWLNDVPKTIGHKNNALYATLTAQGIGAYATLINTAYASFASKFLAMWALMNGMVLFLSPILGGSIYKLSPRLEEHKIIVTRKRFGSHLLTLGIFLCGFAWGIPKLFALGMAWATIFVGTLLMIQDYKAIKVDMKKINSWLVAMALCAFTLTYRPKETDTPNEQAE